MCCGCFYVFQFHLVRLKACMQQNEALTKIFQFHLVRLKAERLRMTVCELRISIPFSTIKSKHSAYSIAQDFSFQFHLVRLKDRE